LRLAPLANFAPHMIERLLGRVELTRSFDALISTDAARTFKPDPRAYALGPERFDLPQPFGPTTPVSPFSIRSSVGSTKDLKPSSRNLAICTGNSLTDDAAGRG
jgi:hypothetical protein